MGQITKVTPDMIQVANNVTSTTIGNTTSGISLTFDSSGVITSAANVVLSVANTQLTGTITNAQLGTNAVSNTKIAAGAVEQYFADTGYEAQFRNRIINGDMRIDQRNAGAAVTASSSFPVDRFVIRYSMDGTCSVQQDSDAPLGFTNSLKFTTTAADTDLTSTQSVRFEYRAEGRDVADLGFGSASAKTITLSFWVRSSLTGTFGGSLMNSANDRSYPFNYTISAANTWEQKTITVAGDTTGTWLADNGIGIRVFFGLGAGTDRSGTAGAWASDQYWSATGAVSVIGTLDATWYITGVQLEVGSVATPFERRPFGAELALCQRYLPAFRATSTEDEAFATGGFANGTVFTSTIKFPVTARVPPTGIVSSAANTFTVWFTTTSGTGSAISFAGRAGTEAVQVNLTTSGGTAGQFGQIGFSGSSSAYIYFTGCEL
jgi:hypothetical protein